MASVQHRHDITDAAWAAIEPHTIGNKGSWGGNARNTRQFSTRYSGFCVPARRGGTCRPNTAIGRIHIDASAAGAISGSGSICLKH